jgi:hypothetical protein
MEMSPRSRLVATATVGAVVFGAALAAIGHRATADPRVTAAGLLTAGALTVALLLMVWARRRTGAPRKARRDRRQGAAPAGGAERLAVIPLGDGQAAVIWDEPAAPGRPQPTASDTADRETAAATAAIWDAVDAAVLAADPAAEPPSGPARHGPAGPRRPRRPWGRSRRDDPPPDSR